jgi:hypothetical protein
MVFPIIVIISALYFKRRRRLRRRNTIDSGGPAGDTQVKDFSGTLTPFTLPSPITGNISAKLQKSLTESSPTAFPPTQPHIEDQPSTSVIAGSERGHTLVEMRQNMQNMQDRLVLIEGHLSRENDRDRDRDPPPEYV